MFNVNGSNNTINVNFPTQQQLNLETKEPFSARLEPSIIEIVKKQAADRGTTTSKHAGNIIKKYIEIEPHLQKLQSLLDTIIC